MFRFDCRRALALALLEAASSYRIGALPVPCRGTIGSRRSRESRCWRHVEPMSGTTNNSRLGTRWNRVMPNEPLGRRTRI